MGPDACAARIPCRSVDAEPSPGPMADRERTLADLTVEVASQRVKFDSARAEWEVVVARVAPAIKDHPEGEAKVMAALTKLWASVEAQEERFKVAERALLRFRAAIDQQEAAMTEAMRTIRERRKDA